MLNLARRADPAVVRFEVAWTARRPGTMARDFLDAGTPLHHVLDTKLVAGFPFRLARLIRRRRYDAVCAFCAQNVGRTLLAASACGVRSRLACYRSCNPHLEGLSPRAVYLRIDRWLAARYATRIVGNSPAVLDGYFPHRPSQSPRYRVLPNGIDAERFAAPVDRVRMRASLGLAGDDLVIGHVGRFDEAKNHRTIVRTAARLAGSFPNLRLLLVGYGPMLREVQEALGAAGLSGRAVLPGLRTDVPEMLACMDLFLFPSLYEGCPNALLEAMAAGLPFVASNIPSNVSAVPAAARRFLVDPDDDEAQARLAASLLADPLARAEFGALGRRHVADHYSVRASVDALLGIIAEDLQPGGAQPDPRSCGCL